MSYCILVLVKGDDNDDKNISRSLLSVIIIAMMMSKTLSTFAANVEQEDTEYCDMVVLDSTLEDVLSTADTVQYLQSSSLMRSVYNDIDISRRSSIRWCYIQNLRKYFDSIKYIARIIFGIRTKIWNCGCEYC